MAIAAAEARNWALLVALVTENPEGERGADYKIEFQAEGLGFADAAPLPSMRHVIK